MRYSIFRIATFEVFNELRLLINNKTNYKNLKILSLRYIRRNLLLSQKKFQPRTCYRFCQPSHTHIRRQTDRAELSFISIDANSFWILIIIGKYKNSILKSKVLNMSNLFWLTIKILSNFADKINFDILIRYFIRLTFAI